MKPTFSDSIKQFLVPLLPAILGGLAHGVNCRREDFSWWWFMSGMIMAVFVGHCVYCLVAGMDIAEGWKTAAVAVSGYSANEILPLLRERVLLILKKGA